jgi:dCTP deaminase
MCVLSDVDILEYVSSDRLIISPFDMDRVQPASYDVTLDASLMHFQTDARIGGHTIDTKKSLEQNGIDMVTKSIQPYCLQPGEFLLGSTVEAFRIPDNLVGRVDGKSSLGRLGLIVHATAGYIDPGFEGTITLEITNLTKFPIILYAGMPIAQISFSMMNKSSARPYGSKSLNSKYQNQNGPTESRYSKNYDDFEAC